MKQIKPDTPFVYLAVEQITFLVTKTSTKVESLPEYFGIDTFL